MIVLVVGSCVGRRSKGCDKERTLRSVWGSCGSFWPVPPRKPLHFFFAEMVRQGTSKVERVY